MRRWLIGVVLAMAVPLPAEACECSLPYPKLEKPGRAPLPPDPTLYVFVESDFAELLAPVIIATQLGEKREVDVDEIFHSEAYAVKRLRIHAGPGPIEITYLTGGDPLKLEIGIAREAQPLPQLVSARFEGTGHYCGEALAWFLEVTGHGAAAMELRGIDRNGIPHVAYFPVSAAMDDWAMPKPDGQYFLVGATGCGTNYFDASEVEYLRQAELVRLGTDGSERVVARDFISLDSGHAALPTWLVEDPAPPPPPAKPAPTARATTVTWRLGAAAGGGLTVGAVLMFLLTRASRNRSRRGLAPGSPRPP